jgi:hypothetical protein
LIVLNPTRRRVSAMQSIIVVMVSAYRVSAISLN